MKYLLYLDAALAALGVAMTLCISFVCLIYAVHQAEPGFRSGLPNLLAVSACFVALALAAGAATYGLWKRRRWNWPAQAVLLVLLPVLYLILRAKLDSP